MKKKPTMPSPKMAKLVLTTWAALGLGIIMIGAMIVKVTKLHIPFATTEKMGWECDLGFFTMCLVLMTLGSGMYALMP